MAVDFSGKAITGTFCTRISPGCQHCYASVINKRFGTGLEYTVPNLAKHEFFIDEKILAEPLNRKKPARIFVGDMFDLFHEAIPFRLIKQVWDVAAECDWHTFQVLTKRAQRMREFSQWIAGDDHISIAERPRNLWLGVSAEDQKRADERIPLLLQTPAAMRFLSVEPQLEAIDLTPYLEDPVYEISLVICGGESGPGARPFNLAWAESILEQCKAAGVPFFMKQIGGRPYASKDSPSFGYSTLVFREHFMKDRKGGDPSEWPEHLRVREFPQSQLPRLEVWACKSNPSPRLLHKTKQLY